MTGERSTWRAADFLHLEQMRLDPTTAEMERTKAVRDIFMYLAMTSAFVGIVLWSWPSIAIMLAPVRVAVTLKWAWEAVVQVFRKTVEVRWLREHVLALEVMNS